MSFIGEEVRSIVLDVWKAGLSRSGGFPIRCNLGRLVLLVVLWLVAFFSLFGCCEVCVSVLVFGFLVLYLFFCFVVGFVGFIGACWIFSLGCAFVWMSLGAGYFTSACEALFYGIYVVVYR